MSDAIMVEFEKHYRNMVQFDKYLGMHLTIQAPGKISYELEVKAHHLTAPQSIHGGVTAAMMDATMGLAALSFAVTKGNLCATVEFKLNYLRQVGPGAILISQGRVKHAGERIIVSRGDIVDSKSDSLVATGLGTFTQYPMDKRPDIDIPTHEISQ